MRSFVPQFVRSVVCFFVEVRAVLLRMLTNAPLVLKLFHFFFSLFLLVDDDSDSEDNEDGSEEEDGGAVGKDEDA